MALTEMSDSISAELAVASNVSVEPVVISEGFKNAVALAVVVNAGYLSTLSLEQEALSRVGVAESVRKPQLVSDVSLGGLREFGQANDNIFGIAGGISLSQLIYDGGGSTAMINRATAEALGARAERRSQANVLALEVARAWIDVWQFQERVTLLKLRTSDMESLVGQMEQMAANGLVDRAALDGARRQIVSVQLEEARLQADLADAQVRFRRYFRQAPGMLSRPAEIITPTVARAQAEDWQNAPSLEALAARVIAARHGVEEIEATFGPRIRLQTGLRTPLNDANPASGTLGLGIDYSLWDGQRRLYELDAAIARRAALETQLQEERNALAAELEVAVTRLSGIEQSIPLVAEQIRLSASESDTSRSQISTGQSTLSRLVEAEVETYRAQDRQIAIWSERQIILLTIAARTGELGRAIGLEQADIVVDERHARNLVDEDQ